MGFDVSDAGGDNPPGLQPPIDSKTPPDPCFETIRDLP